MRGSPAVYLPLDVHPAGGGAIGVVASMDDYMVGNYPFQDPASNARYPQGSVKGLMLNLSVYPGASILGTLRWQVQILDPGQAAAFLDTAADRSTYHRYVWADGTFECRMPVSALMRFEKEIFLGTRRRYLEGGRLVVMIWNESQQATSANTYATCVGHCWLVPDR